LVEENAATEMSLVVGPERCRDARGDATPLGGFWISENEFWPLLQKLG